MKGRKPLPTNIHLLNGNPSKIKGLQERNEPQPSSEIPTCPAWLSAEAKREWKRICPELAVMGVLTIVDRTALAGYCAAYGRWRRAEEALADGFTNDQLTDRKETKDGEVIIIVQRAKKPEVQIAIDSLTQVKAFCTEFGLTPSARVRMVVPGQKNTEDKLENLLSQGKQN